MAKKRVICFVPADKNNLKYYEGLKNSLRKFHSEEELPLLLIDDERITALNDPRAFYRMTPLIAKDLIKDYELVIKLDADQVITAPLTPVLEDKDYDVAVVNNSSPQDYKTYPYQFMNIHPLSYVNCGFVAMRSEAFINWWDNICHSILFEATQMKEQDWLNVMVHSGNYKVRRLDEGDSFWGLASKGYWPNIKLVGDSLILPRSPEWPDKDKIIRVIHWGGGQDLGKMNFRTRFQPDVSKRLEWLISGNSAEKAVEDSGGVVK